MKTGFCLAYGQIALRLNQRPKPRLQGSSLGEFCDEKAINCITFRNDSNGVWGSGVQVG